MLVTSSLRFRISTQAAPITRLTSSLVRPHVTSFAPLPSDAVLIVVYMTQMLLLAFPFIDYISPICSTSVFLAFQSSIINLNAYTTVCVRTQLASGCRALRTQVHVKQSPLSFRVLRSPCFVQCGLRLFSFFDIYVALDSNEHTYKPSCLCGHVDNWIQRTWFSCILHHCSAQA